MFFFFFLHLLSWLYNNLYSIYAGLNIEKIGKCMGDPEADADNPVLKEEQDAQVFSFVIAINS